MTVPAPLGEPAFTIGSALGDAPRPEHIAEVLSRSLGEEVEISYPVTNGQGYLDVTGRPCAAPAAEMVQVLSSGRPVAALSGPAVRAGLLDSSTPLSPRVILQIANSSLIAQRRAEVLAMYDARAAVVDAQDSARAHLERDLHDGAQQLVLALLIELRLIADECSDEPANLALIDQARTEIGFALEELRAIAHGIFPVALNQGGLVVATDVLSEQLGVGIDVEGRFNLPPPLLMAVYRLIESVAEQVAKRGSHSIAVSLSQDGGLVRIGIRASDGGVLDAGTSADRISALRGEIVPGPNLTAVLPLVISGPPPDPPPELPTQLDGSYRQDVTFDDLRAMGFTENTLPNGRPGTTDTGAPINCLVENAGVVHYTLDRGTFRWNQHQPGASIATAGAGYFVVSGNELVLADRVLARDGRPMVMRFKWSRHTDGAITLEAIDEWNLSRVMSASPWLPVTA